MSYRFAVTLFFDYSYREFINLARALEPLITYHS